MKKTSIKYIVGAAIVLFGILLTVSACCVGGISVFTNYRGFAIGSNGFINSTESNNYEVNAMEIKKLNVDAGYANFYLKEGDTNQIDIKTENVVENCFSYKVDGDTLKISYNRTVFFQFFGALDSKIYVTVPKGTKFEDVNLDFGVGSGEISGISSEKFDLHTGVGAQSVRDCTFGETSVDTGAGSISMSGIQSGSLTLKSGTGEINFDGTANGDTKISSNVGKVLFTGSVKGNVDVKTDVGEVIMTLSGNMDDYKFKTDNGIGSITVNGVSGENFGNGEYSFNAKSGIGSIVITIN